MERTIKTKQWLRNGCLALACVSVGSLVMTGTALAQVPAAQTTTAAPDRIEDQIRDIPDIREPQARVEVKKLYTQAMPENAEDIVFSLSALVIEGVSSYKEGELAAIYADRLGQTITLADLYGIAAELTRKYRNDGFVLTQVVVPPQTIEKGIARLQVVEGYIDKITIDAKEEEKSAVEQMGGYADHLRRGGSLNIKDLEHWLLLLNDLPGITARSVISPSKDKTGAADLLIIVERDPYEGVVGINNYGSRFLGPLQMTGSFSTNSLFGKNEQITGEIVVAPDTGFKKEMAYFALSYLQPVGHEGTTVETFASYTRTDPGFTLDQFDVEGRSRFASITVEHPLIRSRAKTLKIRGAFDVRNLDSRNNIEARRHDSIRALRAGVRYEYLDNFFSPAYSVMDLQVSQGIDILGASDEGDSALTRAAGNPDFTKVNFSWQRLQRLAEEWNLFMAARGQWSDDPLLSSEEFGVGGINYGRGYDPSEIIGDDGIAGKVELQWKEPHKFSELEDYYVFGFYDAGTVWNQDATTSALKRDTITSAGVGVSADFTKDTTLDMTLAYPLNRDVQTKGDKDPHFYMGLRHKF